MKPKQNHRTAPEASHRMLYSADDQNQATSRSPYPFQPNQQHPQAQWREPWMGEGEEVWRLGGHWQPQSGKGTYKREAQTSQSVSVRLVSTKTVHMDWTEHVIFASECLPT